MTLHLGILQTDSVLDGLQERFGDYPEMIGGLVTAEDPSIRITTYDVQRMLPTTPDWAAY